MNIFLLFLIFLPFIFIEATVPFFPITLIFVFVISLFLSSQNKYLFVFIAGLCLWFFSGSGIPIYIFFLCCSGFIDFYNSNFPEYKILNMLIFIISEIAYYYLYGLPIIFINLIIGTVFFIFISILVKPYIEMGEQKQLQFDFIKDEKV